MDEAAPARPGEAPGRAAGLTGTSPPRVHGAAVVALGVALAVTASLAFAAWSAHEATEDRIMERRTLEAAAVFTSSISAIEIAASSAADVVAATGGDADYFETLMAPQVGPAARFSSASVWSIEEGAPGLVVVVGEQPALGELPAREIVERLGGGGPRNLRIVELFDSVPPRLGYTYGQDPRSPLVAYMESALPEDRTAVPQAGSAFADLHYAIYLDEQADDRLLVADRPEAPAGRRASEIIPFGDRQLILVMSTDGVLGSTLSAALPWIIVGLGVLLALLFALLYERVLRRRDETSAAAAELARIAEDNARLFGEQRSVAQTLQQSLLIEELPEVPGLELAARYEVGAEGVDIGGDWYDVIVREEDCVLLVVGDVSGRGVRAATVMAALRHSIRALALQGDAADEILAKLSRLVSVEQDGHFATVLIVEADPRTGSLAVASAGHACPLLITDDGVEFVELEVGVPVGVIGSPSYRTVERQVLPGAALLGFTDGLFERRGETVDVGLERLRRTVAEAADRSLPALLDLLVGRLAGTAHDDAAILGVRWPISTTQPPT